MRVLGISPLDKDATVSFVEDGRVLFACGEERLSRKKLQDGFPHRALQLGLEKTGWEPDSIDAVAYAFFDGDGEEKLIRKALVGDAEAHNPECTRDALAALRAATESGYAVDRSWRIPGLDTEESEFVGRKSWWKRLIYSGIASRPKWDWLAHRHNFKQWAKVAIADHHRWTKELSAGLSQYGLHDKLHRYRHHDSHAANAFYASGFHESLLVTIDGYGSGCCGGIYVGDDHGIRQLHSFDFPGSLGIFYEHVTSALGFTAGRHEGKVVGLAAYGDPSVLRDVLLSRFECVDGDIRIRGSMNYYIARAMSQRFAKRDIAAAYQYVLEDVTKRTVDYWVQKTGLSNVAVSGGVNANVKLNQRIREISGVQSVFVYPNMGDGGCATGAAMLALDQQGIRREPLSNAYHGPEFSDSEIADALQAEQLAAEKLDDIEPRIADVLTQNHIVARFHGRMEYGPRALGNRSILYPASDPEVNQWLNHQLGRTEFMPFAPAAMAEHAGELFQNIEGCEKTAEFMTITFDCTEKMKELCPAAVHIDGTARPQLVSETTNPSFYRVLKCFYERTGVPVLINTSFNMHEEPIVCTPQDAVRAFLLGNIDYLAIGSYLVPHPKLKENMDQREQRTSAHPGRHAAAGIS